MTFRLNGVVFDWDTVVHQYAISPMITLLNDSARALLSDGIQEDSLYWYLSFKDTLLLPPTHSNPNIRFSKKFKELFPTRSYCGEQYACIVSPTELCVYNLYTGNLVANYIQSFSFNSDSLIDARGWTRCKIKKEIFYEYIPHD